MKVERIEEISERIRTIKMHSRHWPRIQNEMLIGNVTSHKGELRSHKFVGAVGLLPISARLSPETQKPWEKLRTLVASVWISAFRLKPQKSPKSFIRIFLVGSKADVHPQSVAGPCVKFQTLEKPITSWIPKPSSDAENRYLQRMAVSAEKQLAHVVISVKLVTMDLQ